jgi:hypothetical protein
MAFLRPSLEEKMVHSSQLRTKIDTEFVDARERFKAIIKVSITNVLQRT